VVNRIRRNTDDGLIHGEASIDYEKYKHNICEENYNPTDPKFFRELIKLSSFSAPTVAFIEQINDYRAINHITDKHTYVYNFEYVPDFDPYALYTKGDDPTHMCEMFFVFNNFVFANRKLTNVSENDKKMATIMNS
jgi:carboxylesterase type B